MAERFIVRRVVVILLKFLYLSLLGEIFGNIIMGGGSVEKFRNLKVIEATPQGQKSLGSGARTIDRAPPYEYNR